MRSFKWITMLCVMVLSPSCGPLDQGVSPERIDCTNDSGCPEGFFCNLVTDVHVCLPHHCRVDDLIEDETALNCGGSCNLAYRCDPGEGCKDNNDCVSKICLPSGKCSESSACSVTNPCPSGQTCNSATAKCEALPACPTTPCPSGQTCSSGQCVPVSGVCNPGCQSGQVCNSSNQCVPVGPVQSGNPCTTDSECSPAICLPTSANRPQRVCSFYTFSFKTTRGGTTARCFKDAQGTFSREFVVNANVDYFSDQSVNESSCLVVGLNNGECTQTTVKNGTNIPCSGSLNPGSQTATWNGTR